MSAVGSLQAVFLFAAIAGLSLAVRLCPVVFRPSVVRAPSDAPVSYVLLAEGLTKGCGFAPRFGESCGPPELERTPGYPLFLAAMPSSRSALVVQDVLGAGVCLLIALSAWRLSGLLAGLLTETLLCFDVPSIVNSNSILSDTLFTALITSSIVLQLTVMCRGKLERRDVAFLLGAGLLLGIAALVRPIGQVLILEIPISFALFRGVSLQKRVSLMFAALCLPIIVVLGWSYRNYEQRGIWTFSTIGAVNLYAYRAAGVLAYETGRSFDAVQTELIRSVPRIRDSKLLHILKKSFATDPRYGDQLEGVWIRTFDADPSEMQRRGLKIVLDHPWAMIIVTLKGFLRNCFWVQRQAVGEFLFGAGFDPGRQQRAFGNGHKLVSTLSYRWLSFVLFVEFVILVLTWIGVGLALWSVRRTRPCLSGSIFILLFVSLLLLGVTAGPEASDRFRVPAMPALALVAAFGWAAAVRRCNRNVRNDAV